jgi:hypothetical protein
MIVVSVSVEMVCIVDVYIIQKLDDAQKGFAHHCLTQQEQIFSDVRRCVFANRCVIICSCCVKQSDRPMTFANIPSVVMKLNLAPSSFVESPAFLVMKARGVEMTWRNYNTVRMG